MSSKQIFQAIDGVTEIEGGLSVVFLVRLSYVELYNNTFVNLLGNSDTEKIVVREHPTTGTLERASVNSRA